MTIPTVGHHSLGGDQNITGDLSIGTNKFTISASTGFTTISNNAAALPAITDDSLLLIAAADGTTSRIILDTFANSGAFTMRTASGTAASPTALTSGQTIGTVGVYGYGATAYSTTRARVFFSAAEAWTDSAQGTYIGLSTTATASTTLNERVRITAAGNVLIGSQTDDGANKLQITGTIKLTNTSGGTSGTATPAGITLHDTSNGSTWDTVNPFAVIDFSSADASNVGAGGRARIGAVAADTGNGITRLGFFTVPTTAGTFVERLSISSTGTVTVGTTSSQQFVVTNTASAVNYVNATGAITTASPTISALGTDTNVSLTLTPKGTGRVILNGTSSGGSGTATPSGLTIHDLSSGSSWDIVNPFAVVDFSSADGSTLGAGSRARIGTVFESTVGSTARLSFFTAPSTAGTFIERMSIKPNGDVVVGSTTTASDGTVTHGNTTTPGEVKLDGAAATNKLIRFLSAGSRRWAISGDNVAESGSNVGSDLRITSYDDSGSAIFTTIVTRSTGAWAFVAGISTGGTIRAGLTGNTITLTHNSTGGSVASFAGASTGGLGFNTSGGQQLLISHIASAVNYVQIYGGGTGVAPTVASGGSDTNVGLSFTVKGAAPITFTKGISASTSAAYVFTNAGGLTGDTAAGFWRGLQIRPGTLTISSVADVPVFSIYGEYNSYTDPSTKNIYMRLSNTTVAHDLIVSNGTSGNLTFATSGGTQLFISHTASVANYVNVTGGATGNAPSVAALGTDTNISLQLTPKGTGGVNVTVNSGGGTGTSTPRGITIYDNTSGAAWDTTNPWAVLEFSSADTSLGGSGGVRARIGAIFESGSGGTAKLSFATAPTTAGGMAERMNISAAGTVAILSGTASTSASTGALVVTGGVGITGSTYVLNSTLGGTATNEKELLTLYSTNSNSDYLIFRELRITDGSDWTTAALEIRRKVDSTDMAFIRFGGTSNSSRLSIGSGSTERFAITSVSAFVSHATASTSTTSGALIVTGGVGVSGALYANTLNSTSTVTSSAGYIAYNATDGQVNIGGSTQGSIELGATGRTGSGTPFIDFHSSASSPDFDVRIIASGGTSTSGQGTLSIEAASISLLGSSALFGRDTEVGYSIVINSATANTRAIFWRTASSNRWSIAANNTAEGGSNAGTDLAITGYSDAAASIHSTIVTRATGTWTFPASVVSNSTVVAKDNLVVRGGASEGGQLILGYGGSAATTITAQANNTWNVDVDSSNSFRVFRINSSGTTLNALHVSEGACTVTLPSNVASSSTTTGTLVVTGGVGISGALYAGTALVVGSGTGAPTLTINGAAANSREVRYLTNGALRWSATVSSTAESGSNVGSDYVVNRWDDSGAYLSTPFYITRSTGLINLNSAVTCPGAVTLTVGTTSGSSTTGTLVVTGGVGISGDIYAGSSIVAGTYFNGSVNNGLTAAGTTRADALQLAKQLNRLGTVASGTGVILPVGVIGMAITIFNAGANPVKVYASASETIDGTSGSTGVTLTNALRCMYFFVAANTWVSSQLGAVSA